MTAAKLSPARQALADHIAGIEQLRADLGRYEIVRDGLERPLLGVQDDLDDLEAVRQTNNATVQSWLNGALAGDIAAINIRDIDTSSLEGHEERARCWDRLRVTLKPAMDQLMAQSTAAAHHLAAMEARLPEYTAAVAAEEAGALRALFEQQLEAARLTGARLQALRAWLGDGKHYKLAERVPPGFTFELIPTQAEIAAAAARWDRYAGALNYNPRAPMEQ